MILKKKKKPLISIITVTKNSSKTIKRCLNSLKKQKFKNFEHIVIDGKSKDSTIRILKKKIYSISYLESSKDKNLWDAMNKGIKNSRGEIIGILNSDDVFYSNALSIVNKYFKNKNVDFLFGAVKKKKIYHGFYPKKIYYRFNIFPSHSVGFFIRKKIHNKIGLYDKNLNYCADYDLIYRLLRNNYTGYATKKKEILGKFYVGGISGELNILKKLYYESKVRLKNKQNFVFVMILFCLNVINHIKYKLLNFSQNKQIVRP